MKVFAFIFINCFVVGRSANNNNLLSVPEDVMSFIMGCDGRFSDIEGPKIPVTRTAIDTASGTSTKEVSMMNIAELRRSLLDTVEGEDVVSQILAQVEESLEGRHELDKNTHCTNVKIEVPQQEVKGLNEQLQAIVQQNNYQLLEQVNTLFSFKLNSFYKEFEEMLEKKLAELGAGLIQLQQAHQAANQKPSASSASETASSIGETRIFLSNTPVHNFPPTNVEHAAAEAGPDEDYIVEEQIVESEGLSASNPDQLLDYPEDNEVPLEQSNEGAQHANEMQEPEPEPEPEPSSTSQYTTTSTTQSTTQSTTTTSTTTTPPPPPPTTATATTTTTTTTTPAPPQSSTTEPQESSRSSFRRRRPGPIASPRRPGIGRPIPSEEESAAALPEEGEEIIEEGKDSESQGLRRTRMEEMRRRRKEMLDRLRG